MDPPKINYVDNNSILLINPSGKIRQVFVPFKAEVVAEGTNLYPGTWVFVEEVRSHQQYRIIYRISSTWWPYHLFRITVLF